MALFRTHLYSKGLAVAVALCGCLSVVRAESQEAQPPELTDETSEKLNSDFRPANEAGQ